MFKMELCVCVCIWLSIFLHVVCMHVQSTHILPGDPLPPWPPLASCWGPHMSQDDGTSKHWSDHKFKQECFILLHQLAGWYPYGWEQPKSAQRSCDSSLFCHLSGGTKSRPKIQQQNLSPSSMKDFRLIFTDFTSTPHSITCMFISSAP